MRLKEAIWTNTCDPPFSRSAKQLRWYCFLAQLHSLLMVQSTPQAEQRKHLDLQDRALLLQCSSNLVGSHILDAKTSESQARPDGQPCGCLGPGRCGNLLGQLHGWGAAQHSIAVHGRQLRQALRHSVQRARPVAARASVAVWIDEGLRPIICHIFFRRPVTAGHTHRSTTTLTVTFIDSKLVTPVPIQSTSHPGPCQAFPKSLAIWSQNDIRTDVIHPVSTFQAQEKWRGCSQVGLQIQIGGCVARPCRGWSSAVVNSGTGPSGIRVVILSSGSLLALGSFCRDVLLCR